RFSCASLAANHHDALSALQHTESVLTSASRGCDATQRQHKTGRAGLLPPLSSLGRGRIVGPVPTLQRFAQVELELFRRNGRYFENRTRSRIVRPRVSLRSPLSPDVFTTSRTLRSQLQGRPALRSSHDRARRLGRRAAAPR